MVAGGGGRVSCTRRLSDQSLLSRSYRLLLFDVNRQLNRSVSFPAKQPPPATVTMVAGCGDLITLGGVCGVAYGGHYHYDFILTAFGSRVSPLRESWSRWFGCNIEAKSADMQIWLLVIHGGGFVVLVPVF
ncbi:hypothetical protein LXL04_000459 [Taraxacum kok-saghyz]